MVSEKKNKYLEINVTNELKYLSSENYESLLKDIIENIRKWKYTLCLQIRRVNFIKMIMLFKVISICNTIPIKSSIAFFKDI